MLVLIAIGTSLFVVYWIKNAAGINLFNDLSLSTSFPFSLVKLERNVYKKRGAINIEEDFESLVPIPTQWWSLHKPKIETIWKHYGNTGCHSSRCLIVTSESDRWWHITHRYIIEVREKDKFYLEASFLSAGRGGYAEVQVSAFDAQGEIVRRNMWHIGSSGQGKFEEVKKVFTISPGVASIRLRLAGKGRGEFKFDSVRFGRLE